VDNINEWAAWQWANEKMKEQGPFITTNKLNIKRKKYIFD
jgi:hypothetical protein